MPRSSSLTIYLFACTLCLLPELRLSIFYTLYEDVRPNSVKQKDKQQKKICMQILKCHLALENVVANCIWLFSNTRNTSVAFYYQLNGSRTTLNQTVYTKVGKNCAHPFEEGGIIHAVEE